MADEIRPAAQNASSVPPPSAPADAPSAPPNRGNRLLRVLANETEGLHPRLRLIQLLAAPLPHFAFNRLRTALYRLGGLSIGARSLLLGSIELAGPGRLHERFIVGHDSQITTPLYADVCAPIKIGHHVYLGHHVVLITTDHAIGPEWQRCGGWRSAPITIEDGVWIGARATILPGVTVGRGSVVAAGAVVTRDVPPNTLVGGVPAKVLRQLDAEGNAFRQD